MSLPELQYRNNDPTENVQVDFTDLGGRQRVLSFVATRPHWCGEPQIYGDLFDVPLETVFERLIPFHPVVLRKGNCSARFASL
jgi:hypothetical protein